MQHTVCKCSYGCKNIAFEEKKEIFNKFYKKTYNEQTFFLESCLDLCEPKRRVVQEAVSKRQCTVKYFLCISPPTKIQVCQKTLCNILAITRRRIQILVEKLKQKIPLEDQRGLHNNRPHKTTDSVIQSIKDHIGSFPTQENHYSRASSKASCLDPSLSLLRMYRLFQEKFPDIKASYDTYRSIFRSDFNLRFGTPRSDTCKVCDKFYIQLIAADNDESHQRISNESKLHHMKSEKAYSQLKEDSEFARTNSNNVVLCVDLQQVIFTPNLSHSDVFYQRQYSNYNFAVHNMGNQKVMMFQWHESLAKRGSAEIASCLLQYITHNFQVIQAGEERKLTIWSDRCVGQNNNFKMITLFAYLVQLKYFTEINQKFLVSGHSFLPCDRDFALIEKNKKSAKLYAPEDVTTLICNARVNNPFQVFVMKQSDFVDLSPLEQIFKRDPNLKVTQARWIRLTADEPGCVAIRTCHNILEGWQKYELLKKQRGRIRTTNTSRGLIAVVPLVNELNPLYDTPLPITSNKKTDLMAMSQYLPPDKRNFYENLTI